ncbi:MAG: tryptophan--tRNA ligase [Thermoprotei archaeon]|nr:tryptophan--tRNA ligase [Thermoprotei archaeon]
MRWRHWGIHFGVHEVTALEKKADYERLIREFGAEPITDEILSYFKDPHILLRRRFFYAHRSLREYLDLHAKGHEVAIVSGRGPSNYMHLGHLMLFAFIFWLQKELKARVYIPLSDDEKYVFGKVKDLKEAYKYALDNALDILALGFQEGRTFLYISTHTQKIYEYATLLSRYLTYNTVKATFGLSDSANAGTIFYAAVQAAHILMPTLEMGYPVLVPIGADQDPYMRLTRDVAERVGLFKPAAIYSIYVRGLTGEPMSASRPETCIFTKDEPEVIRKKIWMALTGGRASVKEQRELGGEPEKCVVFEWLSTYVFQDEKKIEEHYRACRSGEILCGDCKRLLAASLIKRLEEHRRKRKSLIDKLERFFIHDIGDVNEVLFP